MKRLARAHIHRIKEVVNVFYDVGFDVLIRKLELQLFVPLHKRLFKKRFKFSRKIEKAYSSEVKELPKKLRLAFETLGPTFIKLGQILSLRPDIIGEEAANELRKLQYNVPTFPTKDARKIIEDELGQPIKSIFNKFNPKPIGAASLAQVYHAKMKNGQEVAIKVLRPGIHKTIKEDLAILNWIANLLEEHVEAIKLYEPKHIIAEFSDWTIKELNLLNEATNIAHFREMFKNDEDIYIPAVIWEQTTEKVLTMEFSSGIRVDEVKKYKSMRLSKKKMAALGIKLGFMQFFEYGFFHGDPHPGNFFALRGNKLCLHDFGIVGRLNEKTRLELIGFYVAFLEKDMEGSIKHMIHMAEVDENSDIEGFTKFIRSVMEQWFYAPTKGKRLSKAFYQMVSSGIQHKVKFSSDLILLSKAGLTMESTALMLDPDFNFVAQLKPYLRKLITLELKPDRLAKKARNLFLDSSNLMDELPEAARNIVQLAQKENVGIRLNTGEFHEIKKEIDRQTDIRILALVFVATVLASGIMLHFEGIQELAGLSIGKIGLAVSIGLFIAVVWKIHKRPGK